MDGRPTSPAAMGRLFQDRPFTARTSGRRSPSWTSANCYLPQLIEKFAFAVCISLGLTITNCIQPSIVLFRCQSVATGRDPALWNDSVCPVDEPPLRPHSLAAND